jgi:hypothetical protein
VGLRGGAADREDHHRELRVVEDMRAQRVRSVGLPDSIGTVGHQWLAARERYQHREWRNADCRRRQHRQPEPSASRVHQHAAGHPSDSRLRLHDAGSIRSGARSRFGSRLRSGRLQAELRGAVVRVRFRWQQPHAVGHRRRRHQGYHHCLGRDNHRHGQPDRRHRHGHHRCHRTRRHGRGRDVGLCFGRGAPVAG